MKFRTACLCFVAVAFLGTNSIASSVGVATSRAGHLAPKAHVPPNDQTLYDNGPDDGQQAYTINSGFKVTNAMHIHFAPDILPGDQTLTSVTFSNWLLPGDSANSVDWSITTAPFGGTTLGSGTATLSGSDQGINGFGFDVVNETFSLGGLNIANGDFWLQLENEVVTNGDPGFWGESNGPSQAFDSALGEIPSESFLIRGDIGPPIPEPGSLILLATGMLGGVKALRRKFFR